MPKAMLAGVRTRIVLSLADPLDLGVLGVRRRTLPAPRPGRALVRKVGPALASIEMERLAREHSPSIRQDGWRNVLEGITSVEEVLRVTQSD